MARSSFQPCADQEELIHHRSRLKIRRAPSSAALTSCASSFHGSCGQQTTIKKGCTTSGRRTGQPLIVHTVDPEVQVVEPAEFMSLVQELTGSPATQKLVRMQSMREQNEIESLICPVRSAFLDRNSSVQHDPLKAGQITILAPAAERLCSVNADSASPIDAPAAPWLNPHLPSALNQASYGANPLAEASSYFPRQLILDANRTANDPPLSSISINSATHQGNYSAYGSPVAVHSPLSPANSSLTTSSGGCFCVEEGVASSSSREAFCYLEEGSTVPGIEEDGGIDFFVFSRDSYYGSHNHTAAQDDLDVQLLSFSSSLEPFSSL